MDHIIDTIMKTLDLSNQLLKTHLLASQSLEKKNKKCGQPKSLKQVITYTKKLIH